VAGAGAASASPQKTQRASLERTWRRQEGQGENALMPRAKHETASRKRLTPGDSGPARLPTGPAVWVCSHFVGSKRAEQRKRGAGGVRRRDACAFGERREEPRRDCGQGARSERGSTSMGAARGGVAVALGGVA